MLLPVVLYSFQCSIIFLTQNYFLTQFFFNLVLFSKLNIFFSNLVLFFLTWYDFLNLVLLFFSTQCYLLTQYHFSIVFKLSIKKHFGAPQCGLLLYVTDLKGSQKAWSVHGSDPNWLIFASISFIYTNIVSRLLLSLLPQYQNNSVRKTGDR